MTSLSYNDIFSRFLGSVTDYDFINLSIDDLHTVMTEKLHSVTAKSYVRHVFSKIVMDDEVATLTFEMATSVDNDADREFVIEMLSKGMIVEWLAPQVNTVLLTKQKFTSNSEGKFYSQSAHLAEVKGLYDGAYKQVRDMIRDRGFMYNEYLRQ